MNTVKRWLAGFLSFAMIFTSSAFSNVALVSAREVDKDDKNAVAAVTVGQTTTYYDDFDDAMEQALADKDLSKEVYVKLLQDIDGDDDYPVGRPLTIIFGGHTLDEDIDFDPAVGDVKDCGKYSICAENVRGNGSAVNGISFAIHDPEIQYDWEFDDDEGENMGDNPFDPIWTVSGYSTICGNCGTDSYTTLPTEGYDYSSNFYNENLKQYEYREWTDKDVDDPDFDRLDDNFIKATKSSEGYTIMEGPTFKMDGLKVLHDEDGKPIVDVKIVKNSDGKVVENPDILMTVATATERTHNRAWDPDGDNSHPASYFETMRIIGLTQSTCTRNGMELYKVVINDPDGNVMETRYIIDDNLPMVPHKKGAIDRVQFLTRVGNEPVIPVNADGEITRGTEDVVAQMPYFATEGEAMDAAERATKQYGETGDKHTVIKVSRKRVDILNGRDPYESGEKLDGVVDTTVYFYWYWMTDKSEEKDDPDSSTTNKYYNTPFALDAVTIGTGANEKTYARTIVEEDGSFQYRAIYDCAYADGGFGPIVGCERKIEGEAIKVNPMDDEQTAEDFAENQNAIEKGYQKPIMSRCEEWNYDLVTIPYEFTLTSSSFGQPEQTVSGKVCYYTNISDYQIGNSDKEGHSRWSNIDKPEASFTHQPDGKPDTSVNVDGEPATCYKEGIGVADCKICGDKDREWTLEKLTQHSNNNEGETYNGNIPSCWDIDPEYLEEHTVTMNKYGSTDRTMMTVEPTCTEDGGDYLYCMRSVMATGEGHWFKVNDLKATGHDLSTTVTVSATINPPTVAAGISYWYGVDDNWATYEEGLDYVLVAKRKCNNERDMYQEVRYHSVKGQNTDTDIYSAVDIVVEAAGKDCVTPAKTTYTVKELTDSATKKEVTLGVSNSNDVGTKHDVNVRKFRWSSDFRQATGIGTCNLCKAENMTEDAEVKQETAQDGITTFTATCNGATESKKAYSLKDAVVTFDADQITDGNAVKYGTDLPDVVVTINGTVINPSLYNVEWGYSAQKKLVYATVDWTTAVKKSGKAAFVPGTKTGGAYVDAAKQIISSWTYDLNGVVQREAEEIDATDVYYADPAFEVAATYRPENTYTLIPKVIPDDATIKYSVLDKALDRGKIENRDDFAKYVKKLNELKYDKDKVEIHDAGRYYVYAEITQDGYTTWRGYVAAFYIVRPQIYVQIDDLTVTVGEDPLAKLAKRAYWIGVADVIDEDGISHASLEQGGPANKVADVNWAEDFEITSVGGKELKGLDAGTYKLNVQAPNYNIITVNDTHIGTLVVEPKAQEVVDAEAIANELATATTDDALAAAYAKYAALSDELKKIVESNAAAKANLEKAKAAYDAKQAAEKKAADEKAAGNVINMLATVTDNMSQADAKKIVDAFNALTADQKALVNANATAKANLAKAQSIANKPATKKPAKSSYKFTKTKYTIKAGKSAKIKGKKTTDGKLTFKKTKGNKKITVTKGGKIKVKKKGLKKGKTYKIKVKVTAPATANYKALKVTKQIKVKVK